MSVRAGEIEGQLAIDSAINAADLDFLAECWRIITDLVQSDQPFTSDAIWQRLPKGVSTSEPRALGGVLRQAARDRLIRPTGRYVKSSRVQNHARPCAEWVRVS